ncbi:MAG: hypothetical protein GY953_12330 [bacterium]|nr:hypothetical protein [bacterium]
MNTQVSVSQFRFKRPKPDGVIQVLNDKSYLMGEYNQRTGKASWLRVVLATQRGHVESWLQEHYPVSLSTPHRLQR